MSACDTQKDSVLTGGTWRQEFVSCDFNISRFYVFCDIAETDIASFYQILDLEAILIISIKAS